MKKLLILLLYLSIFQNSWSQDTTDVEVNSFGWDTIGLHNFLYGNQKDIQTIIDEFVTDSFKSEIVRIFTDRSGLLQVDTPTLSFHKLEWRFGYHGDDIEWGEVPPNLDKWTYHLAEECLTEFIYFKISSRPTKWKDFTVRVHAFFDYWSEEDFWWEVDVEILLVKEPG